MRSVIAPFLAVFSGILLQLSAAPAWGASQMDAEAALDQANAQYFKGVVSGKAATPDQRQSLKAATVGSASNQLGEVMWDKWRRAVDRQHQIPQMSSDVVSEDLHTLVSKMDAAPPSADLDDDAAARRPASAASGIQMGRSGSYGSSGPGLDGSKVPRLLEFGNVKK